jgi:hypothetical protein
MAGPLAFSMAVDAFCIWQPGCLAPCPAALRLESHLPGWGAGFGNAWPGEFRRVGCGFNGGFGGLHSKQLIGRTKARENQ